VDAWQRWNPAIAHGLHGFVTVTLVLSSWNVLEFFGNISGTWEVLENDFNPGKSWKFKLKVLESPERQSCRMSKN